MAQKRMFDKSITNSDNFLELPDSSQILYFHLSMNADDDGFVDNWKSIMRMTGTKQDDLKILITKSYVIPFETGIIVIKHWRMNNYLRADRYKETTHKLEKSQLILGANEEYLLANNNSGIPMVHPDKNSIDKNSINKKENIKRKKRGKYKRILLTDKEYEKLVAEFGKDFIDRQIDLLDEYVESNNNKNKYTNFNLVLRKSIREQWFRKNIEKDIPIWFDKELDVETPDEDMESIIEEMTK